MAIAVYTNGNPSPRSGRQPGQHQDGVGPVQEVHKDLVPLDGGRAPATRRDRGSAGTVDRLAVPGQSLAHLPEPGSELGLDAAVGYGADLEQQVRVVAGSSDQQLQEVLGALVPVSRRLKPQAPFMVSHISRGSSPTSDCSLKLDVFWPGRSFSNIWKSSPGNGRRWWLLPRRASWWMSA